MLHDQQAAVEKAIAHTAHIHSRVGFTEGSQVMDPRAPKWKEVVETHVGWWQKVYQKNCAAGMTTTVTTEFGPYPYLQHLPYTQVPIYDQWEVNIYMMTLLRKRLTR